MFDLKFDTRNAAFEDPGEVPRILRDVAARIKNGATDGAIQDRNGNTVGTFYLETEDNG